MQHADTNTVQFLSIQIMSYYTEALANCHSPRTTRTQLHYEHQESGSTDFISTIHAATTPQTYLLNWENTGFFGGEVQGEACTKN